MTGSTVAEVEGAFLSAGAAASTLLISASLSSCERERGRGGEGGGEGERGERGERERGERGVERERRAHKRARKMIK